MENRLKVFFFPVLLFLSSFAIAQEYGTASYYSDDFDGMETAYGVRYDKNQLTAAHKRHPYGTMLKVTRIDNNKSVIVKVIDKGPWIKGRIVDLSRKAAEELGLIADGVADVRVELADGSTPVSEVASNSNNSVNTSPKTANTNPNPNSDNNAVASTKTTPKSYEASEEDLTPKGGTAITEKTSTTKSTTAADLDVSKKVDIKPDGNAKVVRQNFNNSGLYKIVLMQPEKKGFGVQVSALGNYESVMRKVADLQAKWFDNILVFAGKDKSGKSIYKVMLGPFDSVSSADAYGKNISSKFNIKNFVVDLSKLK